jgi:precorrin-2 dehydrogenase/sirohydrochlorin ferrochelatase
LRTYYPILLNLDGRTALVVGGGEVALRKVQTLLKNRASIRVVSQQLTGKLKNLVETGKVTHIGRNFKQEDLDETFLVIVATDDKELNHSISQMALERGLLVNTVDQPEDCNFIVPSVLHRGDLQISISTSGKSPALARKLREQLSGQFGDEYALFLILMGRLRKKILSFGLPQEENSQVFNKIVNSGILNALARKDRQEVELTLKRILPEGIDLINIINDVI